MFIQAIPALLLPSLSFDLLLINDPMSSALSLPAILLWVFSHPAHTLKSQPPPASLFTPNSYSPLFVPTSPRLLLAEKLNRPGNNTVKHQHYHGTVVVVYAQK